MRNNKRYFQGFGSAITLDYEGTKAAYYEGKPSLLCDEEELDGIELHKGINSNSKEWEEVNND